MYYINDSDSEYILNKHHSLSSDYDIMNCVRRHEEIFDESTGMDGDEIIKGIREQDDKISHRPHSIRKAMALRFVLDNTRISCDKRDRYPAINAIDRPLNQTLILKWKNEVLNEIVPEVGKKREDFENDGIVTIWPDYDHSVPYWERVFGLGFKGILDDCEARRHGIDYVRVVVSKTAKEATDAAVFEIKVVEGEIEATKTVNISITDYATEILAGEYGYAEKTLMYYMLNYVGEAAEYFEGEADATIAKLLEDNAVWNNQTVDKTYTNAIEENLDGYFAAAGVVLEDAPAYTLTFKKDMAFEGTVTVAYGNGYVRNFAVNKAAGEDYKLMVGGMKIYNFGTELTVTVTPKDGEATVGRLNLDAYAKYHTDNAAAEPGEDATEEEKQSYSNSKKALPLIEALYDYVKISELYKGGNLVNPGV